MHRIAVVLSLTLPCFAGSGVLYQASFDPGGSGWTAVHGSASPDSAVRRGNSTSMRLDGDGVTSASVRSAPVALTVGNRYELSGWVRTDALRVRDLDRSPIAAGATLRMASMPFDVHSASLGNTTGWTRLKLRFVASKEHDAIELSAGDGGAFSGHAWFSDVSIEQVSSEGEWPAREAVQTYGPAYRYPVGGWIYLHIEGAPYERGYQHGRLMSREIVEYMERSAADLDPQSKNKAWDTGRAVASALFLRGFDREMLEEMRGIADGAADAGAKWNGRRVDLVDVIVSNTVVELEELAEALPVTPTGLEGLELRAPDYSRPTRDVPPNARCSAFAATGPATRDGRMVIGHLTMWPLTLAEQTNIMLDIKPANGHRVLMQSFPGGIQSGTDWLQNDAGIVLTETTIRQSPYNVNGTPIAYRARMALQYGDSIDKVVEYLGAKNDGLYTNEWLIGDAKTNEIAMYELGTWRTKLWRSSRNEWFGGTEGFYWGDNNAKDLGVRLEYAPDPRGDSVFLPYVPEARDLVWQKLYGENKGRIDEQFAFTALRTPPLVSSTAMDAKVATADMASHLMTWALFGKPNDREWVPTPRQKEAFDGNAGIYSSGYRLISTEASDSLRHIVAANEKERAAGRAVESGSPFLSTPSAPSPDRLWKGWILPAADDDNWLAAGSAAYFRDLHAADVACAMEVRRAEFRNASLGPPDARQTFRLAESRGALLLDALRKRMGDDRFFDLMTRFFAANAEKPVAAEQFIAAAGPDQRSFFNEWLHSAGLPGNPAGPSFLMSEYAWMSPAIPRTLIVYGTVMDACANRYAAEKVQKHLLGLYESEAPVRKDFELSDEDLRTHDLIFVGRPETNSALDRIAGKLGLEYDAAVFRIAGATHASDRDALALAATNPLDPHRSVLLLAGNSALETVRLASGLGYDAVQYAIFESGKQAASGFLGK